MIFIGIDQSTTNTGVVVLTADKKLETFCLITPPKKMQIEDRILYTKLQLFDSLSHYNIGEVKIGMESISFGSKGRVAQLSMLLGYIYFSLKALCYQVELFTPSHIKKLYCGKGNGKKEDMLGATDIKIIKHFEDRYKKIDDLVDAYAIAKLL